MLNESEHSPHLGENNAQNTFFVFRLKFWCYERTSKSVSEDVVNGGRGADATEHSIHLDAKTVWKTKQKFQERPHF